MKSSKRSSRSFLVLASIGYFGCAALTACVQPPAFDPAAADPAPYDVAHPPSIADVVFEVEGAGLNAIVYEAQGVGPHPTVVLLHGYPGNERNLDLAQTLRRAGWNVVFFHYRGSWGSGGRFSFEHVLEDVATVVEAIRVRGFAAAHRIDPDRIALVGHSMGGFAALISAAELAAVDCVVSMAGGNLGGLAKAVSSSPDQVAQMVASLDSWSGPIRGASGTELVDELMRNLERFDTTTHASALADTRLLLIAGARDAVAPREVHHDPMVAALLAADATALETEIYANGDHSFSGQRIALGGRVALWLGAVCDARDE